MYDNRNMNPPQPWWCVGEPAWDLGCIIEDQNSRVGNCNLSTDELGLSSRGLSLRCHAHLIAPMVLVHNTVRHHSASCLAFRYLGTKELLCQASVLSSPFMQMPTQRSALPLLSKLTLPTRTALSMSRTIVCGAPQGPGRQGHLQKS